VVSLRDVVIAEVAGSPVADGRVEWQDSADGGREYSLRGEVDPAWRCRGIGRGILRLNERALLALAAAHGAGRDVVLSLISGEHQHGARSLAEQEGYARSRPLAGRA
jgi:hypothetical protein